MIRYSIATLAKRAGKRRDVTLPPIHERLATINQYNAILNRMLAEIARYVKTVIMPTYQPIRMTRDAEESDFEALRIMAVRLAQTATDAVNRILELEAKRHTETFSKQAKSVLGIDISSVVSDEDLGEYMRSAAARNAGLIKSLGADTVKEIERIVLQNQINGGTSRNVEKELIDRFGVSKSRAKLIAQDQTAKITAELNGIRQRQAGIGKYEWQTSEDERVRPLHKSLNGKIYHWGESTGAEGGQPPGMPIRCRCVALGIVEIEPAKKQPFKAEAIPDPGALDVEMKAYIMAQAARTGVEHLWSYDRVTGKKFAKFGGNKKHVGWDRAFNDALNDPRNNIISHHNHPSSSSFSDQDLVMLNTKAGLKGLHAHGHNGSTFYAEPGPKLDGKGAKTVKNFLASSNRTVHSIVQAALTEKKITKIDDTVYMHSHLTMLLNEKRGFISNYKFTLKGATESAIVDNQVLVDSILAKLDELVKGLKE